MAAARAGRRAFLVNNKADRHATLRLGQQGRVRGTDRPGVKRRWEVDNDTGTGTSIGKPPTPARQSQSGGTDSGAGNGARSGVGNGAGSSENSSAGSDTDRGVGSGAGNDAGSGADSSAGIGAGS